MWKDGYSDSTLAQKKNFNYSKSSQSTLAYTYDKAFTYLSKNQLN